MGAVAPATVTVSLASLVCSGPTILFAVTMVCRPGASPVAMIVAMLQGESEPRWKSAPFRKLLGFSEGPGGVTVRLKVWLNPRALAVTLTAPEVALAATVIEAWPLLPVLTVVAERIAGPVTLNCTGMPTAVPLFAVSSTTKGEGKVLLTIADCPLPDTIERPVIVVIG